MLKYWSNNYLIVFVIALGTTYLAGFLVKFLARKLKILDRPSEDKIHFQPIPRLGGIAIFLGFILSLLFISTTTSLPPKVWGVVLGGLLALLVGIIDDIKPLPAVLKLVIFFILTFILAHFGIILNLPVHYVINLALTLVWLIGITSAFNAIDHMDGLAAGLAVVAGLSFLAVAIQTGQWLWGVLAIGLAGANLGFLRHNFHPASLFMGDSGSFFIGFTLGALGIMGGWSTHPVKASLIPILILGVPLFDLGYLVIYRQRTGLTRGLKSIITYCGTDHLGHRLMTIGLSQKKASLLIYLIAFTMSLGAVILRNTSRLEAILLLIQFILISLTVFYLIALIDRADIHRPR